VAASQEGLSSTELVGAGYEIVPIYHPLG
jgi:hypothetical protein